MLKNILKLDGAQQLSKKEQKEISGGAITPGICVRKNGNTGQSCTTDSQCTGPNFPVCHWGCCNTWA
jgi:hypothetical protein